MPGQSRKVGNGKQSGKSSELVETFTGLGSQGGVSVTWIVARESCLGIQFLLSDFCKVSF